MSAFEIRITAADARLADQATKSLVELANSMGAKVNGPVPLPVVNGKLKPEEDPAKLQLARERRALYKRVLRILEPSEDAMLAFANVVLPNGVQSQIQAV